MFSCSIFISMLFVYGSWNMLWDGSWNMFLLLMEMKVLAHIQYAQEMAAKQVAICIGFHQRPRCSTPFVRCLGCLTRWRTLWTRDMQRQTNRIWTGDEERQTTRVWSREEATQKTAWFTTHSVVRWFGLEVLYGFNKVMIHTSHHIISNHVNRLIQSSNFINTMLFKLNSKHTKGFRREATNQGQEV